MSHQPVSATDHGYAEAHRQLTDHIMQSLGVPSHLVGGPMSEEQGFLAAIDADPEQHFLKAIYADWLDERGETDRAEAWRWLASEGKVPTRGSKNSHYWFDHEHGIMLSWVRVHSVPWVRNDDDYMSEEANPTHPTISHAYQWAVREYLAARQRGWLPQKITP